MSVQASPANDLPDNTATMSANVSKQLIARRPDISSLPTEDQIICFKKRQLVTFCIEYRDKHGKVPDDVLAEFLEQEIGMTLQELGINSRARLSQLCTGYQTYQITYPEEDAVNFFYKRPAGRPVGQDIDEEMEAVALGAYITRDRKSFFKDVAGLKDRPDMDINTLPSIDYVRRVLRKVFPEQPISLSTLKRLIKRLEKKHAAIIKLAREGERALWVDAIPKMENDCDRPDEGWQSDARYLSFYVKYKEKVVRVVLIIIIDVFSRCILRFALVPREDQDTQGKWHNIDFTGKQVCVLLATVMSVTERRPYCFITDKGSQYKATAPRLRFLTTDKEPPITPILGFPGHPWCRGIVEVYNYLIDRLLCEIPGFVENDDDPICRRDVQTRADLLEFEVLENAIEAKLEAWNTDSVDGKPSRYDIWKNSPGASLAAPEDIRLELLAGEDHVKRKTAVVRDVGIEYKRTFYKLEDKEDSYDRWAEAAAERREIQFRAITLHHGLLVLVDLNDGHGWERVVPQSKQRPSKKKHVIKQRATVKRFHGKLGEAEEKYKQALATRMGGLPKTDAIDKEPYFPSEMKALDSSAENSTLAREVSTASDTNASKARSPVSIPLDLDVPKGILVPPDKNETNEDDVMEPKTLEEGSTATVPEPPARPVASLPMTREEQVRANAKANLAARLRQHRLSKDTEGAGESRS